MTSVLPELRLLPRGLVLDGELVAWEKKTARACVICVTVS